MQPPDLVRLNVGGTAFACRREVLTARPGNVLAAMLGGAWAEGGASEEYIDRDPTHFSCILAYLRDGGEVPLPETSRGRRQLRAEAAFYCLDDLVAQVDAAEARHAELEALREQKLRAQALLYSEQAAAMKEAVVAEAEAAAAAAAASAEVEQLEPQLTAAHDAAAAAHAQMQGAGLPGARAAGQAAWHAAALRWHDLQAQHTAARTALARAQAKEAHARRAKLAALRAEEPPPLPASPLGIVPLPPRPPVPHRRPPAAVGDFIAQQERAGAAADPALRWGQLDWLNELLAERLQEVQGLARAAQPDPAAPRQAAGPPNFRELLLRDPRQPARVPRLELPRRVNGAEAAAARAAGAEGPADAEQPGPNEWAQLHARLANLARRRRDPPEQQPARQPEPEGAGLGAGRPAPPPPRQAVPAAAAVLEVPGLPARFPLRPHERMRLRQERAAPVQGAAVQAQAPAAAPGGEEPPPPLAPPSAEAVVQDGAAAAAAAAAPDSVNQGGAGGAAPASDGDASDDSDVEGAAAVWRRAARRPAAAHARLQQPAQQHQRLQAGMPVALGRQGPAALGRQNVGAAPRQRQQALLQSPGKGGAGQAPQAEQQQENAPAAGRRGRRPAAAAAGAAAQPATGRREGLRERRAPAAP